MPLKREEEAGPVTVAVKTTYKTALNCPVRIVEEPCYRAEMRVVGKREQRLKSCFTFCEGWNLRSLCETEECRLLLKIAIDLIDVGRRIQEKAILVIYTLGLFCLLIIQSKATRELPGSGLLVRKSFSANSDGSVSVF